MFRRIIILMVLLSLVSLFSSCTGDEVLIPDNGCEEQNPEQIVVSAGRLHNEILTAFSGKHLLFGEKLSGTEGIELFIRSANEVFDRYGCPFRVDGEFIDACFARFAGLRKRCGYDFSAASGNVETAITYLEKCGSLSPECAMQYMSYWKKIKAEYIDPEFRMLFNSIKPVPMDPVLDVAQYSQEWWDNYIAEMDAFVEVHPELRGWWDRWKKRIREWGLIGSDFIGAMLASPGVFTTAAGAALASIAFSIIWPPY